MNKVEDSTRPLIHHTNSTLQIEAMEDSNI